MKAPLGRKPSIYLTASHPVTGETTTATVMEWARITSQSHNTLYARLRKPKVTDMEVIYGYTHGHPNEVGVSEEVQIIINDFLDNMKKPLGEAVTRRATL